MNKQETLEDAKNKAWQNYEYGRGHLYSRTFFDAFELGYNLAKEQDKNKYSEREVELIEYIQWVIRKIDAGNTPKEIVRLLLFNRDKIEQIKNK